MADFYFAVGSDPCDVFVVVGDQWVPYKRCDTEEAAQALVGKWKQYITDHYYPCTDEILAGLGEMYVSDQRFTDNIDVHGIGTARFMAEAIRIYCGK